MRQLKRRFTRILVVLLAIGALTFAASEALAEDAATACTYNPPGFLGECASNAECQTACDAWGGELGVCGGGCCRCYF